MGIQEIEIAFTSTDSDRPREIWEIASVSEYPKLREHGSMVKMRKDLGLAM